MGQNNDLKRRQFIMAASAGAAAASLPVLIRPAHSAAMPKMLVGEAPFISKGPNMIALQKGYYKKMGLDVKFKFFFDGALMVAPLLAGELDLATLTVSAGFSTPSRGAAILRCSSMAAPSRDRIGATSSQW